LGTYRKINHSNFNFIFFDLMIVISIYVIHTNVTLFASKFTFKKLGGPVVGS
jgi:hypothetical protein